MATNGILMRKTAYLQEQLSVLHSWHLGSLQEYSENQLRQRAVERQVQVRVEIGIDICERILTASKLPPAETSADNLHEATDDYYPEFFVTFRAFCGYLIQTGMQTQG